MPIYSFLNTITGEVTEHKMKIAELGDFKKSHPELEIQVEGAPSIGDPVRLGRIRIDDGFRDVLNRIADRTPGGKGLKDQIR